MAGWDGAGNFTRAHDWTDDRDAAVKILASRHDTEDDNFATGINACFAKNGENSATGNLDLGGFRFTNAGAATARTDLPQSAQVQDRSFVYAAGGGTADVQTATLVPAITAYAGGQRFSFLPAATNTSTTPTLNVNAVGAKTVKKLGSAALVAGDIVINKPAVVEYNSNDDSWELLNPATAVQSARAINTGSGLSGGGDLSADRTLVLDITGTTAETTPAVADEAIIYDATATANRKMTLANLFKVVNALTEDTTPDVAADFVVTYDTNAAAAKKVLLSNLPVLPDGYLFGLGLSNAADAAHDITFAVGSAAASGNALSLGSAQTKQIDVTWATGTGAGGLNSTDHPVQASTTYHCFITDDGSGGIECGFDTSLTATNLLSDTGGSSYRRVGSIKTDGSSDIRPFIQNDDHFQWNELGTLTSVTAAHNTSRATLAIDVPTGIKMLAQVNLGFTDTANAGAVYLSDLDTSDHAVNASPEDNAPLATMWGGQTNSGSMVGGMQGDIYVRTDTSGQIGVRANNASIDTHIYTVGWIDRRGRDG